MRKNSIYLLSNKKVKQKLRILTDRIMVCKQLYEILRISILIKKPAHKKEQVFTNK